MFLLPRQGYRLSNLMVACSRRVPHREDRIIGELDEDLRFRSGVNPLDDGAIDEAASQSRQLHEFGTNSVTRFDTSRVGTCDLQGLICHVRQE